jgi:hypothetical protein
MTADRIPPKCWGIGLGRTGTTSFCQALELLGYQRVKHNPTFAELKDLDGGADCEVAMYYKYLDYKFPGSKFVLTVRDLDSWLASMEYAFGTKYPLGSRQDDDAIKRRMTLFESVAFDRDRFVAARHRHHADVRRYFRDRPGDLLELEILGGDGWGALCPFLGLPIPAVPFPCLNTRDPFSPRSP